MKYLLIGLVLLASSAQAQMGKSTGGSEKATEGLTVLNAAEACERAGIIMVLVPDTNRPEVYEKAIAPHLEDGDTLMFAHGFNIRFGQIRPPETVDVSMVAPNSCISRTAVLAASSDPTNR